jgi:peptidyl-prolyl cis-trans isomerase B (cyclophilin B)
MKKIILMISVLLLASCTSKVEEKENKVTDAETNTEVAVDNKEENTSAEKEEIESEKDTSMISELLKNNDKPMEKTFQTEMPQNGDLIAVMKTNKGTIKLRLFKDLVPQTVFNFAKHAQDGYYDGLIFHRIIKNFMIQ